nr:hypothetical protein [Tanacetum cinerariifolium]
KTNKRVPFSTGVILTTSVSRPQLKRNSIGDKVMRNNSQGKKQKVEDQCRNVKLSKNKTSVTACNDSLNAKTLNVNVVSAMCDKCVLNDKHDMCVLNSVAKPLKKTVALESNQKPRNITRKLYERVRKACSWWYPKFTPSGYKWKPKSRKENVNPNLVEIILVIVDSGCSKHMTGNLKLLINFVKKFLGTVYSFEGLNHNLFSVGQFCDADLEVAFWKSTCYIRDLKGNDLLTAWLWHRRLSHLNFDTINLLSKNDIVVGLPKLKFINDHLCSSWIRYQTAVARTPEQNGVVERRNRTLVEATRTMLSATKVPLFFWAEAIATSCFTQNRSLVIPQHEKTPYHIINGQKPSVKFFHIFGSLCYIVRDGDVCIFVGYSTQSRAYRVFNKRTRVIVETIHVNFDELPQMTSVHVSSDPVPECQRMALKHDSLSPGPQSQENVTQSDKSVTTSNELDLLFSSMFDELLNGSSKVVAKSSVVSTTDAPNQQYAQVENDEFINIFCALVQDRGETSSLHVDSSNMHTFYQRYPSEHHWTEDHPLEQVIGNPSQSVRNRR